MVLNISKISKSIWFYGFKIKVNNIEWLKSEYIFYVNNIYMY